MTDEEDTEEEEYEEVEDRLEGVEERAEEVLDTVDDSIDRLLSEVLDTRSRVAVYVALRKSGGGDAETVAEDSGLYPDKAERVIDDLESDGIVEKTDDGYRAISPTELVRRVPDRVGEWLEGALERGDDDEEDGDINVE